MRYRKNIDCLTSDELHDLREAYADMYALPVSDAKSFARLASLHGGPPTAYCRHGAPGFFTWHRAYLMAFEDALRAFRCDVVLPYWDWSSGPSTGVPDACRHPTYVNRSGATVANPLYSGPRAGGGFTARRADIDTVPYDDLATSAQAALSATTSFDDFQDLISGVHGAVHVRTGGDMVAVPTAGYDPIFYLHHANVDKLWAQWQASAAGALPSAEATFQLEPFNRPFSTEWQKGSDVESTELLGYLYRRFCFYFPPIRLWEVVQIEWPWTIREQMTAARLVIKGDRMQPRPLEIRAFLDQPDATGRTRTIGNSAFAGAVGFIGHSEAPRVSSSAETCPDCARLGHTHEHARHVQHADCPDCARLGHTHEHGQHGHTEEPVSMAGERFDVALDLTAAVRAMDRSSDQVALKLVAVDANGEQVSAQDVIMGDIEIIIE